MNITQRTKELFTNVTIWLQETIAHYGRQAQMSRLNGLHADLAAINDIEEAVIRKLQADCQRDILEARRNARKLRIELQADIDLLSIDLGIQATKVHNFRNDGKEAA